MLSRSQDKFVGWVLLLLFHFVLELGRLYAYINHSTLPSVRKREPIWGYATTQSS